MLRGMGDLPGARSWRQLIIARRREAVAEGEIFHSEARLEDENEAIEPEDLWFKIRSVSEVGRHIEWVRLKTHPQTPTLSFEPTTESNPSSSSHNRSCSASMPQLRRTERRVLIELVEGGSDVGVLRAGRSEGRDERSMRRVRAAGTDFQNQLQDR
jgi:hypothetical protein